LRDSQGRSHQQQLDQTQQLKNFSDLTTSPNEEMSSIMSGQKRRWDNLDEQDHPASQSVGGGDSTQTGKRSVKTVTNNQEKKKVAFAAPQPVGNKKAGGKKV
jgi:hypothetical protein